MRNVRLGATCCPRSDLYSWMDSLLFACAFSEFTQTQTSGTRVIVRTPMGPAGPVLWTMVDGDQFSLVADGAAADPRHLRREISAAIDQQLWTQAAQHEQGKGLQRGVDLHATRLHLARLRKRGQHKEANFLMVFSQGLYGLCNGSTITAKCCSCGFRIFVRCTFCSQCSSRVRRVPSPLKDEALNFMSFVGDICLWMGCPTLFARSCSFSDLSAHMTREPS